MTYGLRGRISSPRMPKPRFPCSGVRLIRLNGSAEICSTALLWTMAMPASTLQAVAMIRWLRVLDGPARLMRSRPETARYSPPARQMQRSPQAMVQQQVAQCRYARQACFRGHRFLLYHPGQTVRDKTEFSFRLVARVQTKRVYRLTIGLRWRLDPDFDAAVDAASILAGVTACRCDFTIADRCKADAVQTCTGKFLQLGSDLGRPTL